MDWKNLKFQRRKDAFYKIRTMPSDGSSFNGASAPLFRNMSQQIYKKFMYAYLILSIVILGAYQFYMKDLLGCDLYLKQQNVLTGVLAFFQSIIACYLYNTSYQSDCQWIKSMFILFINMAIGGLQCFLQAITLLFLQDPSSIYFCRDLQNKTVENPFMDSILWQGSALVVIMNAIILFVQVLNYLKMFFQLFILKQKSKFMTRITRKIILLDE